MTDNTPNTKLSSNQINTTGNYLSQANAAALAPIPSPPRVAVNEIAKPVLLPVQSAAVVIVPPNHSVHSTKEALAEWEQSQPTPFRRRGVYYAADVSSLLNWMSRHCPIAAPVFAVGAETLASKWANPDLSLMGIGNYSQGVTPAWHDFGVEYAFPVTKAWTEWAAFSKVWMSQAQFAEFVEAHLYEFSQQTSKEVLSEATERMIEALGGTKQVATPSKMYEVANGIKITVKESVEVSLDRATGESTLHFTEAHEGKGGRPVPIPKFFYIRIPIFFGEDASLIGASLRYRNAGGGAVTWSYELFAPDLVVKDAFEKACKIVSHKRVLFMGTPDRPEEE